MGNQLTALQLALFKHLRSSVETKPTRHVVYCTECLGYLPYVFYHWVTVAGQDISLQLPSDWCQTDLAALEKAGLLVKVAEWRNSEDEYDTKITYEVSSAEAAPVSKVFGDVP